MQLLLAWLLLPALLVLLSLGWGLLVERLSGARLPGVLLVPVGLAAIMVVARLGLTWDATAELATPVVALAALAGLALGRARLVPREVDRWAVAAALVVFGVFAAPVVLSGSATFAGYTLLGDTSIHFVLIDRIATHGTDLGTLPPSSYRAALEGYFGSGYPLGGHAALGAVRPLAFIDVAWAFQPFLAFVAAALALSIAGLLRGHVRSGWRVGAVAAVAAQPAIVYGYALQGSIKEVVTLWLVPLLAALVGGLAGGPDPPLRPRQLLPLAVATAASVAAIGVAVAAWLGPMLLVALWLVIRRGPRAPARIAVLAGSFAAAALVLSLPTLLDLGDYLEVTKAVVTTQEEFGNLLGPVPALQLYGIWLDGDYRLTPLASPGLDLLELTYALVGLAALASLFGLLWLARRRAVGPLLFLGSSLLALWYVTRTGSPWADGKALAITAPAVLLVAALGPVALESFGARLEAALLALVLAGAVLVSNAFVYHDSSLAPRERLQELSTVNELAAGRGPLLYTEFEEFGKHFLRDTQPVGATEGITVPSLSPELPDGGGRPPFATNAAAQDLALDHLARFNLLLKRREPGGARPPAAWEREWEGRYYELWRRENRPGVQAHAATAQPGCAPVRELAHEARSIAGAELVAAPTPATFELLPSELTLPAGWGVNAGNPPLVQTVGPGSVTGTLSVARTGVYAVWLYGSFAREISVTIDGRPVGAVSDELAMPSGWIELERVRLDAGRKEVAIVRGGGSLEPGNGDGRRTIGPLVLSPAEPSETLVSTPPGRWRELCGRRLAWVELVTPG